MNATELGNPRTFQVGVTPAEQRKEIQIRFLSLSFPCTSSLFLSHANLTAIFFPFNFAFFYNHKLITFTFRIILRIPGNSSSSSTTFPFFSFQIRVGSREGNVEFFLPRNFISENLSGAQKKSGRGELRDRKKGRRSWFFILNSQVRSGPNEKENSAVGLTSSKGAEKPIKLEG